MYIDPNSEQLVTLSQAAKLFPKPPHIATLHRWRMKGVRGVQLQTILIGGLRYTSKEAITRFIGAQNAGDTPELTPQQRQRQSETAREELRKHGI